MKKIISLLVAMMLLSCLLAGCGGKEPEKQAEPKVQSGFNPKLLEVLGKTYSEIKEEYGPSDGATWILGTAFHFPKTGNYFCFVNQDDLSLQEPAEDSICHAVNATLSDFVFGMEKDKEYTPDEISDLAGLAVESHGIGMDDLYVYSITYEGHQVYFDTVTEDVLASNSFAYIIER